MLGKEIKNRSIKPDKLIEEYFREYNGDISFERFQEICKSPFKMVKDQMSSCKFEDIRLKGFAVIRVSDVKAIYAYNSNFKQLEQGKITEERFNKVNSGLRNLLVKRLKRYVEKAYSSYLRKNKTHPKTLVIGWRENRIMETLELDLLRLHLLLGLDFDNIEYGYTKGGNRILKCVVK